MPKSIKVHPPYKPLVQLEWCCAACSVQWILHRRGYWVDQEQIAKELRISVPKSVAHLFGYKVLTAKKADCGAPDLIWKDAHLVDKFLKKHKIPLKMIPHRISTITNPKEFIVDNLKAGHDIMLAFNWAGLGHKNKKHGHVVILTEIILEKDPIIVIGDPSRTKPKFWKVKLSKLVKSMDKKFDNNERGFYVFKSTKK